MQRLAPLAVCLLVAGSAIFCSGKCAGLKKALALYLHVPGSKGVLLAVVEVIGGSYRGVVLVTSRLGLLFRFGLPSCHGLALRRRVLRGRRTLGRRCIRGRR